MQFRIVGQSLATGQPVDIVIDAIDENAARRAADGMGVAPTAVMPAAAMGVGAPGIVPPPPGYGPQGAGYSGGLNRRTIGIMVGGAAAIAVIVTIIWLVSGGSASLRDYSYVLPDYYENATFIDFDKFRDTDMGADILKGMRKDGGDMSDGLKFKPDDVAQLSGGSAKNEPDVSVVCTRSDMTIEELVKTRKGGVKTYQGFDYLRGEAPNNQTVFITRLASKTYCTMLGTGDKAETQWEDVLSRVKKKATPRTTKEMDRVLALVDGHHFCTVMTPPGADAPEALGIGANIADTVTLKGLFIFKTEKAAADFVKVVNDGKKEYRNKTNIEDGTKEACTKVFLAGLDLSNSGTDVTVDGSWQYSDIRKASKNNLQQFLNVIKNMGNQ